MHVDKYYTSMEHLLNVFDRNARKMGFKAETSSDFEDWKKETRRKLREITGMDSMESCPLQPQLLETIKLEGYRREKMLIQTEPDVWMPFYILIPDHIQQDVKAPCVIAPHGHGGGGKLSVSGREDIPEVRQQILAYNYDYGVKFVLEGFVVFCPDARAFGERREWTAQGDREDLCLSSSCVQLNHMAIGLGQSVTGMWVWDLMRLADYIESRSDCGEIGCAGLSGGGLQTLWLTAMDDRIKCAVVSGYFYGYKDSLLTMSNNCGCNYVPNLWKNVDMGDLGALIAPRPLLIESGSADSLNGQRGMDNVKEQLDITRRAYRLLDAEERLSHYIFEGKHVWNGAVTYHFMNRHMKR